MLEAEAGHSRAAAGQLREAQQQLGAAAAAAAMAEEAFKKVNRGCSSGD